MSYIYSSTDLTNLAAQFQCCSAVVAKKAADAEKYGKGKDATCFLNKLYFLNRAICIIQNYVAGESCLTDAEFHNVIEVAHSICCQTSRCIKIRPQPDPPVIPVEPDTTIFYFPLGPYTFGDLDAGVLGVQSWSNADGGPFNFLSLGGFVDYGEFTYSPTLGNATEVMWIECVAGTEPTTWTWSTNGGPANPVVWTTYQSPPTRTCYEFTIDVGADPLSDYYLDELKGDIGSVIGSGVSRPVIDDPAIDFAGFVTLSCGTAAIGQVIINTPSNATIRVLNSKIGLISLSYTQVSTSGGGTVLATTIPCS